jgi:rhodanese-related sulfurtransferase
MKKNSLFILVVIVMSILLPTCSSRDSCDCNHDEPMMTKKTGLVVINVLNEELYNDCHIKDSINVPFESIEAYAQQNIDKDAEIVLYCSNYMCAASGHACRKLQQGGFTHVYAYEGGMAEWYQRGLPVEGLSKRSYLNQEVNPPVHQEAEAPMIITIEELAKKMGVDQVTTLAA